MTATPEPFVSDAHATAQAMLALAARLNPKPHNPAWAIFQEVSDAQSKGRADAIAVCAWASRRYEVWGVEIKASRTDWLRELGDPAKSTYFVERCDRWYVLAARSGIVKKEELPLRWGLMELRPDGRLFQVIAAQVNPGAITDRGFYAHILRRAHQEKMRSAAEEELKAAENRGFEAGQRSGAVHAENQLLAERRARAEAQAVLDKFAKVTGIQLRDWNVEAVGPIIGEIYRLREREAALVEGLRNLEARGLTVTQFAQGMLKARKDGASP